MSIKIKNSSLIGYMLSILAGLLWGVSGNAGDLLFKDYNISVEFVVTWRLIISGALILLMRLIQKRPVLSIWKCKK